MLTCAWLAQSVEHETLNLRVVGSSPTSGGNGVEKYQTTFNSISGQVLCLENKVVLNQFTESKKCVMH